MKTKTVMKTLNACKKKTFEAGLFAATLISIFLLQGCGVRGKPQPPLQPAELGRGQPSFKRATEEFAFPEVPSPTPAPDPKNRQESR